MSDQDSSVNRQHKDQLFRFIFGSSDHKEWTLALYNALSHTNYKNTDDLEFNTVENVLYCGMKNDISFLFVLSQCLWEHQSTFNPNEPIRIFHHIDQLYLKYEKKHDLYLYSTVLVTFPGVHCVVFYNGYREQPDQQILKLSDATGECDLELKVLMLNINYGRNRELMEACAPLREYAWLVEEIRKNQKQGMTLDEAADQMLDDMPDSFEIKTYLEQNRSEVKVMLGGEYTEEEMRYYERREGRNQGRIEGKAEGKIDGKKEMAVKMLKDGVPLNEVIKYSELSEDSIRDILQKLDYNNSL